MKGCKTKTARNAELLQDYQRGIDLKEQAAQYEFKALARKYKISVSRVAQLIHREYLKGAKT